MHFFPKSPCMTQHGLKSVGISFPLFPPSDKPLLFFCLILPLFSRLFPSSPSKNYPTSKHPLKGAQVVLKCFFEPGPPSSQGEKAISDTQALVCTQCVAYSKIIFTLFYRKTISTDKKDIFSRANSLACMGRRWKWRCR